MTSYSAGSAFISILPSLAGFATKLKRELSGVRVEFEVPVKLNVDTRGLAALRDVIRTLPAIVLDADSSPADREIAALRARLAGLSNQTVGINISGDQAVAEITAIRSDLERLSRESPHIGVRVDAGTAEATLAAVEREASHLDGRRINARVIVDAGQAIASVAAVALAINEFANRQYRFSVQADVSGASSAITGLIAKVSALGGLGGVVGGFGGALGGLGAAGAVAAGGLGATILASLGVGKALTALGAQQSGAGAAVQKSATQQQSAAYAIASAQDRVKQAAQSADRARVDGARSVADAVKASSKSVEQALASQAQAQRTLRTSATDLRMAQASLNDAWEAGRRSLQDLQQQVRGNAISVRQAVIDVADAQKALDDANRIGDPDQINRATVAYDRQKATLDELIIQGDRLSSDNAKAQAKGIAGSDQVVSANDRITTAVQKLADATAAARDADTAVMVARVDGADQVARAQEQASQRTAAADHAVAESQRALAQAMAQTGDAGVAAANKVASAFAGLSPAAAEFAQFLFGLKPVLQDLSGVAATAFFPPLQAGIAALLTVLPLIKTVVGQLAGAMGVGLQQVLTALTNPFWTSFFQLIGNAAASIIPQLFSSMMLLAQAGATVLTLFLPLAPAAFDLLNQFAGLVTVLAPFVVQLLGGLIPAASAFLTALTPLGPVLAALQPILLVLGQALGQVLMAALTALAPILVALTPLIQTLGVQLATSLVNAIVALTPFLTALATWMSAHPTLILGVVTAVLGLGVAFQPLLFVLGLVATMLARFAIVSLAGMALRALGIEATIAGQVLLRLLSPFSLIREGAGALLALLGRFLSPLTLIQGSMQFLGQVVLGLGRAIIGFLGPVGLIIAGLTYLYTTNEQFRASVDGLLQVLMGLVGTLVASLMPAFQQVMNAIAPLVGIFGSALAPIITVVAQILVDLINTVLPPLVTILTTVVIPIIAKLAEIFAGVLVWVIQNVVVPAIQLLAWIISNVVGPALLWLWENVVKPVFTAIGAFMVWIFQNEIKPTFDALVWVLQNVLAPIFLYFWHNVVEPSFRTVGDIISSVWQNVIAPTFEALGRGLDIVKNAFDQSVKWIGDRWADLKRLLAHPVNVFIDTVWNHGLLKAWNAAADLIGLPPTAPLAPIPEYATGGRIAGPGTGTSDSILARLSAGEHVWTAAETTAAGGHGAVAALRSAAVAGDLSLPGYATGGPVNPLEQGLGWLAEQIRGGITSLTDPAIGLLRSAFPAPPEWHNVIPAVATKARDKMLDFALGKAKQQDQVVAPGGDGGSGVARWAPTVAQALAMVGQPGSLGPTTLRRMNQESGGNPTIVNRNDINWQRGTPSVGLMQVIGPTYRSNRDARRDVGPYLYGTSVDPLSNILASMHYAIGRYGSLSAAYNKSGGYDQGGVGKGIGWMWKGTGLDERVLPPQETQAYPTLTRLSQQIEAGRIPTPTGVGGQQYAAALSGAASSGAAGDTFNITARDDHSEARIASEIQRKRDFARRTR